jgi:uncharacterized membrane protein YadS
MSSENKGSTLLRSEDWLAVWLGFLTIGVVLIGVRPQLSNFKWALDAEVIAAAETVKADVDEIASRTDSAGSAARALSSAIGARDRTAIAEAATALSEASAGVQDAELRSRVGVIGAEIGGSAGATLGKVFATGNLSGSLMIAAGFLVISVIGVALMGGNAVQYIIGFPVVFALALVALLLAGNVTIKFFGFEFVIFALLIGLFISNVIGLPPWLREAVRTEYYIKTGLVVMGSGVLFREIMQAGLLGLAQALLVIGVVWYACFYIAKKLRVDDEFAVMLSTAVSICGVSAAIAACGAIQGDRKKLSYVTSLVLLVAAPMMLVMPWIIRWFEIPEVVGGAWMGGTIDTSGAVVAAGALLSEAGMKAAVIVKFSQNALIGVAAFALSVWWTMRSGAATGERPSARVIWDRFPKFVLGFMAASLVFSFLIDPATVGEVKGLLKGLRTMWFALAFVCIGLETQFSDLIKMDEGRPALAFLGAQAFNVVWTLLIAYLLFGGILFEVPFFQ